jgi:hypothetical protein
MGAKHWSDRLSDWCRRPGSDGEKLTSIIDVDVENGYRERAAEGLPEERS